MGWQVLHVCHFFALWMLCCLMASITAASFLCASALTADPEPGYFARIGQHISAAQMQALMSVLHWTRLP
jgi:hypothetical protein